MRVVLVDHNALTGELAERFAESVVGCVDHHEDEGRVPQDAEEKYGEPRIVKKVGSCTSLVVQYIQAAWEETARRDEGTGPSGWEVACRKLGLGSILIDTWNLRNEDKTTDDDRRAVEYLRGNRYREEESG